MQEGLHSGDRRPGQVPDRYEEKSHPGDARPVCSNKLAGGAFGLNPQEGQDDPAKKKRPDVWRKLEEESHSKKDGPERGCRSCRALAWAKSPFLMQCKIPGVGEMDPGIIQWEANAEGAGAHQQVKQHGQ